MLVDGLHELLWPEPDVIVLVHQEEILLGYFLLDRGHYLGIELFEEVHHSLHICLVFAVEEHWLDSHAALQLEAELGRRSQTVLCLVQINDSTSSLTAKQFSCIFGIDLSKDATYKLFLLLFLLLFRRLILAANFFFYFLLTCSFICFLNGFSLRVLWVIFWLYLLSVSESKLFRLEQGCETKASGKSAEKCCTFELGCLTTPLGLFTPTLLVEV